MAVQDVAQVAAQVLIDGKWRAADAEGTFHAENPAKGEALSLTFPISRWSDCDLALNAATRAAAELRTIDPSKIADFLDTYAGNIEAAAATIVAAAAEETALPITPRLKDVELPRTTNQLRQAAAAVREESWRHATLDLEKNIRSCFAPIGPVVVFGPNNFPFALTASVVETSPPPSQPETPSSRRPTPSTPTPRACSPNRPSKQSRPQPFPPPQSK
jgi:NADP-dependent aldehyde dehydrogenase